jgi:hypothetical protein
MGMLDHGHPQALLTQAPDQMFNQSGFARTGKTGKAHNFHAHCPAM